MAVTAGMLAKAAATALSNEKLRKGIGWGLVAVLSPVILLIAALCSIGTGGADHNNQAVAAVFYGTSYSTEVPMAFRSHIEEMRSAFSLLDSAVASVNGRTEGGNSLDPIRVKAVFYALCFGEDAPGRREANRFVECFYTWETRTRTVEVESEDGTVTSTTEEYTVAVPVSLYQAHANLEAELGRTITEDDMYEQELSCSILLCRLCVRNIFHGNALAGFFSVVVSAPKARQFQIPYKLIVYLYHLLAVFAGARDLVHINAVNEFLQDMTGNCNIWRNNKKM